MFSLLAPHGRYLVELPHEGEKSYTRKEVLHRNTHDDARERTLRLLLGELHAPGGAGDGGLYRPDQDLRGAALNRTQGEWLDRRRLPGPCSFVIMVSGKNESLTFKNGQRARIGISLKKTPKWPSGIKKGAQRH